LFKLLKERKMPFGLIESGVVYANLALKSTALSATNFSSAVNSAAGVRAYANQAVSSAQVAMSESDFATAILTNMGVTATTVGAAAYAALQPAVAGYLNSVGKANYGVVAVQLATILSGLTADATYGAAAKQLNNAASSAYAYGSTAANTTDKVINVATEAAPVSTFTLTTASAGDTIIGTSGDDSISGTHAATGSTYTTADTIVDSSSTDNDTLTLATTATLAGTGTISGIENIVINHTSFTAGSFTLDKANAGKITVNNLQAAGTDGATVAGVASGSTVTAGTGMAGATDTFTVTGRAGVTALTVDGGASAQIRVGKANDTGTAAAITYNITSAAASTTTSPVAISIEGSAATAKDVANITASGAQVDLVTNSDGTLTDQVETLNLSGNGAAVTYVIGAGAPTTMNVTGSQNVTLSGVASKFSGQTVTDSSTGVSTVKVTTTAGALNLTKVAVDNVNLAVDNGANIITVDGDALQVSLTQTSLTATAAATTKATNSLVIDVNDGAPTTGSITLGQAAITNIDNVTINATDTTAVANASSFGSTATVKITGAGVVNIAATGGTITAKAVDASAATGKLTAFMGSTFTAATGGSAADRFNVEGDTNFTIDGGAGSDTVQFGIATLAGDLDLTSVANGGGNTTASLSNVETIQFTHDANARTLTIDSSMVSGKAIVVKGTNAGDILALKMDGTTVDASTVNTNSFTKTTINGSVIGAASALTITGTAGADDVTGGAQADAINLGNGANTVVDSGDGDDTITGGTGVDTITQAGAGNDTMNLGAGNNVVTDAGSGNDTITATTGDDTVTDAGAGNDTMDLGNGTNIANGNSGDDVMTGGTGVDTFTGGADKDTLNGAAGADKLFGDNAGTKEVATVTISGTQEAETISFTAFGITATATAVQTNTAAQNAALIKTAIETALGDYVTASALTGAAFTVTSKLDGNLVDYTIAQGSATENNIALSAKTDGGLSSGGADTINAGAGADFVVGGEGKDTIDLGAADGDADVVSIVFAATAGGDVISNFEALTGNDVIKFAKDQLVNGTPSATLSSITSTGTVGANDTFVEVTTAAAAGAVDTAAEVVTFAANLGVAANVANTDKIILALQDGVDTYLWYFQEDGTAGIQSANLTLVAKLTGVTDIADGDLAFFA
jgi:Ca2+-binding RTX toxin-like protein